MPRRRATRARRRPAGRIAEEKAVEPTLCQQSSTVCVEPDVVLPPASGSDTARAQPVAGHHKGRDVAGMIFSLACTLAVCLWNRLQHSHTFARLKTSLENKRFRAALENKFLLTLVVLLVGVYCGTLLSAWRMQAKAGTEEHEQGALKMALEDKMMNSDWALKSLGATIDVKRTSTTYQCKWNWFYNMLNRGGDEDGPDTILQTDVSPGKRWCFCGHYGRLVIRLPAPVHPTAIAVQHVAEEGSLSVAASSAPRDVAVYGLDADGDEEAWLGLFMYDVEKEAIQPFRLKNTLHPRAFSYIKVLVLNNWGNSEYTCISRVWVQGKMAKPERPF
ncbi:SUN domain-containing protein 5-like [Colius striatus]|uniref:SUN domain-containing protein 5-like n=1 Tax=Colius striatus TaxID=57412 RepID=UPI002B1E7923|nr:SUN domain-containing protein 5-like [Colius striatus]